MTYTEAAKFLGQHYVSIHRLKRQGKLVSAPDGVTEESVRAYQRTITMPKGYMASRDAADRLKIPRREMTKLAAAGLVRSLPRPGGGWWVAEKDVEALAQRPQKLAVLGMKVEPPPGWLAPHEAIRRLGITRSWLGRLARKGLIRRQMYGKLNAWYSEEDVTAYLRNSKTAA